MSILLNRLTLRQHVANGALLLLYSAIILLHVKTFHLWSQITVLTRFTPLELLGDFHPHTLRYTMMWPAIWLGNITGIDADIFFSFYVLLAAFLMSIVCGLMLRYMGVSISAPPVNRSGWYQVAFFAAWLVIISFMNGTLIFAFLGMCIMLYAQMICLSESAAREFNPARFVVLNIAGMALTSVSTATFNVAFLTIGLFFVGKSIAQYVKEKRISRGFIFANAIIVLIFLPFEAQFVIKDACFFSAEIANLPMCTKLMVYHPVEDTGKPVSFADSFQEYAGHTTIQKAIRHNPIEVLLNMGMNLPVIEIMYGLVFVAGVGIAFIGYIYEIWQLARLSALAPLTGAIGLSICTGVLGVKALLMLLPVMPLLAITISTQYKQHRQGYR